MNELIEFAVYLTGHDTETIEQMYNDWKRTVNLKTKPMKDFKPDGILEVIHKNGQPYGIRDDGGYLLFFPKISHYHHQEERYMEEINEVFALADKIIRALLNSSENPDSSKPKKLKQ